MTEVAKGIYLISDSSGAALARGREVSPPGAEELQLLVLDDQIDEVEECETLQLVRMEGGAAAIECRVLRSRGDRIVLRKIGEKPPDGRRNLRVPVEFATFLYPVSGKWRGRRSARTLNLSSGGAAFYTEEGGLEIGEQVEIAVPTQEGPLLLRCEILRRQEQEEVLCAGRFVDMCEDEEVLVREEVFCIQLSNRSRHRKADD